MDGRRFGLNNGKTRAGLIGLVALYLMNVALELFQGRAEENTAMTMPVRVIFIVLFALIGIALLLYAVRVWKQSNRKEEENQEAPPSKESDSLR